MGRRSYGTGSLLVRSDANGRETWYGLWRTGGRRVKRTLGAKRSPGLRGGFTRAQAEAELRRRMGENTVVISRAERTLDRIEPAHVEEYMHAKLAPLAPKTVTNHLTFLHGLFAFALRRRSTDSSPVALVDRPPAARQHASRIRFLQPVEVEDASIGPPARRGSFRPG